MPKEKIQKKEAAEKKRALWFEPERQMENLMRMEEDIHKMMRDFMKKPFGLTGMGSLISRQLKTIPIDLSETDGEMIAKADLPGFSKEEIRLKVTETTIEISAEKKKHIVQREKNIFRQERSYGAMKRTMPLPYAVKPDETKAKFENGVLSITMPKAEKRKAKEIRPE
jgi:HSP20 family protein